MKEYLAFVGLRVGVGLVGLLPGSVVRRLGGWFGTVWGLVDRDRIRMGRRHMRRVIGDETQAAQAASRMMALYGRYYAEALWARARRVPGMLASTEVEGLERIIGARDAGTGMIYALPHTGNWEAAAPVSVAEGVPVVAVAEVLSNRKITDWFTDMRAGFGIEIVLATGRVEVMRRLEDAIAQNKAVALLADRDLKGRGVAVEFFGEETTMPPGPATLAVRTGAPLFPVGCYFTDDGYRVVVNPALEVPTSGSRTEKVQQLTQMLAEVFEDLIAQAPEQWHLVVPNWPSDSGDPR